MEEGSILELSPSFNSYSSIRFADIATKVSKEFCNEKEDFGLPAIVNVFEAIKEPAPFNYRQQQQRKESKKDSSNEATDDDEFEFACACRDHEALLISANDIFANGQIRSIFPIFNRDLLFQGVHDNDYKPASVSPTRFPLKEPLADGCDPLASLSSPEIDERVGSRTVTYCVWSQKLDGKSLEKRKKSYSTGTSKNWKLRNLIHRSNSKESVVFLARSMTCSKSKKEVEKVKKTEVSKDKITFKESMIAKKEKPKQFTGDMTASAHEIHYLRNRKLKEVDRRRSYLPYRKDLIGFFANMNGLSRNLHPF